MKPLVRVLLVTDDFGGPGGAPHGGYLRWQEQAMPDAIGNSSREFHLGEFVQVLQNTAWLGFNLEITKAHRSPVGTRGMDEATLKADRGADVVGFRFNEPFVVSGQSRNLSDYDLILFFPLNPKNPNPALAPEAEAIARFMEEGGGFFATGDHANLGSELCGLIPRVRSMRRWWYPEAGPNGEPIAPPPLGENRHDTTRAGVDNINNFEDQSDDVAQEIKPRLYDAGITFKAGYSARKYLPHPLLCSPDGPVTWLPDHMHEGWCEVPDKLSARTFKMGEAVMREYPDYLPKNASSGHLPEPLAPEVIASGEVISSVTSPALDKDHIGDSVPARGKRFGVIGAWDGHRIEKGRVIVDSTWHHFFDINISGDRYLENNSLAAAQSQKLYGFYVLKENGVRSPNDQYTMIMWYFRNIIYWLIPARRQHQIWWHSIFEISTRPQLNEELAAASEFVVLRKLKLEHYIYYGQLAEHYLEQSRGHCATYNIQLHLFQPEIPWWEWVQDFVDIWRPIQKSNHRDPVQQGELLSSLGIIVQPEITTRLALGAAVVAAASVNNSAEDLSESAKYIEHVYAIWQGVFNHAVGELGKQLRQGMELNERLEKLVEKQLKT